jgi:hypothetical protein
MMMGSSLKSHASPYIIALLLAIIPNLLVCTAAPGAKVDTEPAVQSAASSSQSKPIEDAKDKPLAISKRQTYAGTVSNVPNRNLNIDASPGSSYGFHYSHSDPPRTLPLSNYPGSSNSFNNYNNYNSKESYRGGPSSYAGTGTGMRNDRDYYPSSSSLSSGYTGPSYGNAVGTGRNGFIYNDRIDNRQPQPYDDYRYNTGYPRDRDAVASVNQEYAVRHGQMRHEEYQKRTGQGGPDYYDPFYFIGMRNGNQAERNSLDRHNSILDRPASYSPVSSASPTSPLGTAIASSASVASSISYSTNNGGSTVGTSPAAPLRNRRNSHHRPNDFYNEISNGDKYDIMTGKSAYPSGPASGHHHLNHNHRLANYHHLAGSNPNPFLTREQLLRNPVSSAFVYFF